MYAPSNVIAYGDEIVRLGVAESSRRRANFRIPAGWLLQETSINAINADARLIELGHSFSKDTAHSFSKDTCTATGLGGVATLSASAGSSGSHHCKASFLPKVSAQVTHNAQRSFLSLLPRNVGAPNGRQVEKRDKCCAFAFLTRGQSRFDGRDHGLPCRL